MSAFEPSSAKAGYAHLVWDVTTGKVLAEEHPDDKNYPASLTKMMTLYLTFEALNEGHLRWDQRIVMAADATRVPPFKLGIPAGQTFTVREAVLGMIVISANDAAQAICDHLAGSPDKCAAMLTNKARKLGMDSTTFRNANGLPDPTQVTTARDMAKLGFALIRDFPDEYGLFSEKYFEFRGKKLRGHNNLMYRYKGMDGIKTGYIRASGFNIVTSVKRDGHRLVGVVMGGKTAKRRDARMAELFDAVLSQHPSKLAATVRVPIPRPRPSRLQPTMSMQASGPNSDLIATLIRSFDKEHLNSDARWTVQIAAVPQESTARSMLSKAQSGALQSFDSIRAYVMPISWRDDRLFRARFSGFKSQYEALAACNRLINRGFDCIVVGKT
ncbi:D-alanyl-D-alanine carboxypeptidase [Consotaella aegiceratis]|uniref:D-alanyl-D-alanine carboxypeptidase n=1 Tax=Consotaella aegiceratis TaxID=3097961 RepID=UPI002F403D54